MVPFDSERSGLPRREPMPGIKRCQFITLLGGATALIGSLLGTQAQQRPLPVVVFCIRTRAMRGRLT